MTSPPAAVDRRRGNPDDDAKALFRRALSCLPGRDPAGRAARLRESAGLMAEAFRAAPLSPSGAATIDPATDALLAELQALDTGAPPTGGVEVLEQRYRAALPALRAALAARLEHYEGAAGLARRIATGVAFRWSLGILVAAGILLATAHRLLAPEFVMALDGQVFWKSSPAEAFTEQRSRHFEVTVDGAAHDYSVVFEAPVETGVLRLDPVDRGDPAEIEILHLELLGANGGERVEFDFEDGWTCVNCSLLDRGADGLRLRPVNDDPYLVGPAMTPTGIREIRIRMRASAPKTLWAWMTGLDKSN